MGFVEKAIETREGGEREGAEGETGGCEDRRNWQTSLPDQ
jgi:hypothetical protein